MTVRNGSAGLGSRKTWVISTFATDVDRRPNRWSVIPLACAAGAHGELGRRYELRRAKLNDAALDGVLDANPDRISGIWTTYASAEYYR